MNRETICTETIMFCHYDISLLMRSVESQVNQLFMKPYKVNPFIMGLSRCFPLVSDISFDRD